MQWILYLYMKIQKKKNDVYRFMELSQELKALNNNNYVVGNGTDIYGFNQVFKNVDLSKESIIEEYKNKVYELNQTLQELRNILKKDDVLWEINKADGFSTEVEDSNGFLKPP